MKKISFRNLIHKVIAATSIILIMVIILFMNKPQQIKIAVGDISNTDVYAPRAIVNEEATKKEIQKAIDAVPKQYSPDSQITQTALDSIDDLFKFTETYRNEPDGAKLLQEASRLNISINTAFAIISMTEAEFKEFEKIYEIIQSEMEKGVSSFEESQKLCNKEVEKLTLSKDNKNIGKNIISLVLTENVVYDQEKTDAAKEEAALQVPEQMYKKNEIIVRKGEKIETGQYNALLQLGLIEGKNRVSGTFTFGIFLLMLVCYAIISFYHSRQKNNNFAAVPISSCCALIVILIVFYGSKILPENMTALLPTGLFTGIVTIFGCAQTSIITNMVLAIFCSVVLKMEWSYAICLIIAGTLASYCFSFVKRRSHLLPASVIASVFYGLSFCALSLIESTNILDALLAFLKGFAGGFISGLITIGSLPLIEWLFNATTPMKLSDLANPENKILKKLLVAAPGTYHHSLTVANISEIAARSVGADPLLTRVGAYYHDIGKLKHPLYFKENQYGENPHNNLNPEESSKLIINHVTDGVEIAVKNRLPQQIIDIIAQHHGTSSTGYFLLRAKQSNAEVNEESFTYPGPAPQTKEAAIVMLADSCEAAVRSIDDKTEEKIENMVRKIATDRVNSGQFSNCNLTFKELETVIKVITKTLGGYFHERIKYE